MHLKKDLLSFWSNPLLHWRGRGYLEVAVPLGFLGSL